MVEIRYWSDLDDSSQVLYHISKSCIKNAITLDDVPLDLLVYILMSTSVLEQIRFQEFPLRTKTLDPTSLIGTDKYGWNSADCEKVFTLASRSLRANFNMHGLGGKLVNELLATLKLAEESHLPKKMLILALLQYVKMEGFRKTKEYKQHNSWHFALTLLARKAFKSVQHVGLLNSMSLESFRKICFMLVLHSQQVQSKKVDKPPYEIWHGQAPKLSYLRVWGCEAFVKHDTLTKPDKLDPRSFKCIFIGYPKETMGYSFYSPSENKVFSCRNAEFFESKLLESEAKIRAIRILIAIAAYYDYVIWQMDVKTAFLNGHLSEEVYMEQPEGFVNPKISNHVCKLKCSIYGLKQASRQWNKRFDDEIKKFGFTQNPDEPCVYLKASGSYVAILILYVDDILLMGNNNSIVTTDVKSILEEVFAMKDLGDAAYILGFRSTVIGKRYAQRRWRQRMQNIPYASALGSIMYAVRCTRPEGNLKRQLMEFLATHECWRYDGC
ncbi:retrotransposon protein, putative, ty1-copia subclass [Tanacetum coccineum]